MDSSDPNSPNEPAAEPRKEMPSEASEDQLLQVVQRYLRELEAGRSVNRQEWIARHPELQPALGECLDGLNLMRNAAATLKPAESGASGLGLGLSPGVPLGDFEIVREVGRGGMGIVYEAIQLSLGRHVALKTLPFVAGLDSQYLQRFRQEAQAAAQLHHANIVPVYAVGCERGVHFYAMQLIDGQSLDCIIRQVRSEAGLAATGERSSVGPRSSRTSTGSSSNVLAPNKRPSVAEFRQTDLERITRLSADLSTTHNKAQVYRTMAALMAQAAEALEYAHRQGIIHRDIKPANLLVDMRHNLWIADFGLAHLHTDQNLTRTGDLLGTLRYASPEQVSGQRVVLDSRTDLYSLGATFYELITLRPVFAGAARPALLHQILNQEPVAPRSIDSSIPPELQTILLKLLSKRPEDRYGSAQEVSDDLHRFLRDEPILAQPPSPMERLRKWGRRHPSVIAALVVVLFAIAVISITSNWLIAQANRRTQAALAAERVRTAEAERNLQQARKAVDYLIQISENDLAGKAPFYPLQKRILETALVYYQDFIASCHDNPTQEAELLVVEERLKKVLDEISVMEGAGQVILLGEKDVQADLMLDEADRRRFDTIAQRFEQQRSEALQGYENLSSEQRHARFLELVRASEQVTQSILSEQQLQRLKQISVQLQGITAFNQPEVAEALTLSDAQREALRNNEAETFLRLRAIDHSESTDERTPRDQKRDLFRSAMDKSLAILTADQMKTWNETIGKPFHGHLSPTLPGVFVEP